MTRSAGALVDSGAFISFLDRSARNHAAVRSLFRDPPPALCTTSLVVAETYGWFLHRLGEEPARRFRLFLRDLRRLEIVDTGPAQRDATVARLERWRGHKLTWVDAASLVVIEHRDLHVVWGTDRDLALEGATVLPGA